MQAVKQAPKDFFDEFGLEVASGEVVIGQTYPIFGMITRLMNETPGHVAVEINFNVTAKMNIADTVGIATLKERMFESGIFVSTVIAKSPAVEVMCHTVIFGKKQGFNA